MEKNSTSCHRHAGSLSLPLSHTHIISQVIHLRILVESFDFGVFNPKKDMGLKGLQFFFFSSFSSFWVLKISVFLFDVSVYLFQNDFIKAGGPMHVAGGKAIVPSVIQAVDVARQRGMLVVWVRFAYTSPLCFFPLFFEHHGLTSL